MQGKDFSPLCLLVLFSYFVLSRIFAKSQNSDLLECSMTTGTLDFNSKAVCWVSEESDISDGIKHTVRMIIYEIITRKLDESGQMVVI